MSLCRDAAAAPLRRQLVRDVRVVIGKALRQARGSTQQERRHRRTRAEAAVSQQAGDGSRLILQRIAPLVANAVVERELSGDECGMGGQRQRRMRVRALEDDSTRREMVDVGCCSGGTTVRGKAIGAQTVDGDENDRTLMRSGFARKAPPCERGAGDREDEQRDDDNRLPALSRGRRARGHLLSDFLKMCGRFGRCRRFRIRRNHILERLGRRLGVPCRHVRHAQLDASTHVGVVVLQEFGVRCNGAAEQRLRAAASFSCAAFSRYSVATTRPTAVSREFFD